jgi:hypothetical protein
MKSRVDKGDPEHVMPKTGMVNPILERLRSSRVKATLKKSQTDGDKSEYVIPNAKVGLSGRVNPCSNKEEPGCRRSKTKRGNSKRVKPKANSDEPKHRKLCMGSMRSGCTESKTKSEKSEAATP